MTPPWHPTKSYSEIKIWLKSVDNFLDTSALHPHNYRSLFERLRTIACLPTRSPCPVLPCALTLSPCFWQLPFWTSNLFIKGTVFGLHKICTTWSLLSFSHIPPHQPCSALVSEPLAFARMCNGVSCFQSTNVECLALLWVVFMRLVMLFPLCTMSCPNLSSGNTSFFQVSVPIILAWAVKTNHFFCYAFNQPYWITS